jgi:hypothetical protein
MPSKILPPDDGCEKFAGTREQSCKRASYRIRIGRGNRLRESQVQKFRQRELCDKNATGAIIFF